MADRSWSKVRRIFTRGDENRELFDAATRERIAGEMRGLSVADEQIVEAALPFTMTGVMRLRALVDSVRYCVEAGVEGAFAECGVWRGGSVLAMIRTLQDAGDTSRDIYLYDTFEGMTEPSDLDISPHEQPALETWQRAQERQEKPWAGFFSEETFSEEDVRQRLLATGYPADRLHFVRGRVEDTIPAATADALALLRLDTDWYESTLHEMKHLYPRLARGGVLIVDDYGHWEGARRAVDEHLERAGDRLLLTPVDYSARVAIKP